MASVPILYIHCSFIICFLYLIVSCLWRINVPIYIYILRASRVNSCSRRHTFMHIHDYVYGATLHAAVHESRLRVVDKLRDVLFAFSSGRVQKLLRYKRTLIGGRCLPSNRALLHHDMHTSSKSRKSKLKLQENYYQQ